jgi:predicted RNA-binding Zn-ribbon protein involved in translation (DUF1610 family)
MVHDNRSQCPVCASPILEKLDQDSKFDCPECGNSFVIKWNKKQRDYRFINLADTGKGEPLGLPRGSVRAIVTIVISMTIWLLLIRDRHVPDYLLNLALVMVGYYFAFRALSTPLKGIPAVKFKDSKEPLYMPKGVIRWILLGGFLIAGSFIFFRGELWDSYLFEFYVIIIGLSIGYSYRKLYIEKMKRETPMWMKNIKSIIVLLASLTLFVVFTFTFIKDAPDLSIRASIAIIGFYFGSRN